MSVKVDQRGDLIEQAVQDIMMGRFNVVELIKMYGDEVGLKLANILSAFRFGMLPSARVSDLIHENIVSFSREVSRV